MLSYASIFNSYQANKSLNMLYLPSFINTPSWKTEFKFRIRAPLQNMESEEELAFSPPPFSPHPCLLPTHSRWRDPSLHIQTLSMLLTNSRPLALSGPQGVHTENTAHPRRTDLGKRPSAQGFLRFWVPRVCPIKKGTGSRWAHPLHPVNSSLCEKGWTRAQGGGPLAGVK